MIVFITFPLKIIKTNIIVSFKMLRMILTLSINYLTFKLKTNKSINLLNYN